MDDGYEKAKRQDFRNYFEKLCKTNSLEANGMVLRISIFGKLEENHFAIDDYLDINFIKEGKLYEDNSPQGIAFINNIKKLKE